MSNVAKRTVTVKGRHGWTLARICADIARHMRRTDLNAEIRVVKDGKKHEVGCVRRTSALRLITIHAEEGDELELSAVSTDAEEALEVFEATAHRCALDWAERLSPPNNH